MGISKRIMEEQEYFLDLILNGFSDIGNIEEHLIDILEEQGFNYEKENCGTPYYFKFNDEYYEFATQDSDEDNIDEEYYEIEYVKKVEKKSWMI